MEKPKVTIGAFAIIPDENGDILYGRRCDDGKWNMPGGGMEEGESPWQAVVRESKEETGLDVEVVRLIGVYNKPAKNDIVFLFLCSKIGGELTLSDETSELKYFSPNNPPEGISERQFERIRDYQENSSTPKLRNQ